MTLANAGSKPVIIDTNIFFSALLGRTTRYADAIQAGIAPFFICEFVVVELFKHKERIAKQSKLTDDELVLAYYTLLRKVTIYKEDLISLVNRQAAFTLCQAVDPADTPHVALTLELDGLLWTGDKKLKTGLEAKGFMHFFTPVVN